MRGALVVVFLFLAVALSSGCATFAGSLSQGSATSAPQRHSGDDNSSATAQQGLANAAVRDVTGLALDISEQSPAASPPVAPPEASTPESASRQHGLVNAAVQGLTGVKVSNAWPVGLMPLLAWQTYLSHRREMRRLAVPRHG